MSHSPSILGLLRRVSKSGSGWRALCPAHDDHDSSLSILRDQSGRVHFKCTAGCPEDSIRESLGFSAPAGDDDFVSSGNKIPRGRIAKLNHPDFDVREGLSGKVIRNRPNDSLLCQPTGWTDEALRAADDQILNELAARHFPRPQTKKDWEHIALIAEIPADKVLSGNLTLPEIHACALAWADRQTIKARLSRASEPAGDPAAAQGGTKSKRRGRKKANLKTIQKEAEIAAAWARARDTGVYKSDFVKDNNLTIRKLKALLDRVAKRNRPSE
jgi:hypothetical protein